MKHKAFSVLVFTAFTLLSFDSCKKEQAVIEIPQLEQTNIDHKWYYFTQNGFEQTSLPQTSSLQSLKPWTESLRISDAATGKDGKGYLLVNKLGILVFDKDSNGYPIAIQDYQLFSSSSAANLTFSDSVPYFTLFRNSFFNKDATTSHTPDNDKNRSYMVRIASGERMLYPVLTYGDIGIADGGEVTGTTFRQDDFIISIKTTDKGRVNFTYKQCIPIGSYESFSPVTNSEKLFIKEVAEQTFRQDNTPLLISQAPQRLQTLLKSIPKSFPYAVSLKYTDGLSPVHYVNTDSDEYTPATAIIDDEWIASVFADGTTYFSGAIKNRTLINNGQNIVFRLPKLPKNYIYSSFCMSYDYLIVGWEENDFYRTGRSGFLIVDMANLLCNTESSLK